MTPEFSQYKDTLSRLALETLDASNAGQAPPQPPHAENIRLTVPAAVLLLDNQPEMYPALSQGVSKLVQVAGGTPGQPKQAWPKLADPAGHYRDEYWPLALHLHLAAFRLRYEQLPTQVWSACEDALPTALEPTRWIENHTQAPPPPHQTALLLWSALCLLEYALLSSRDVDLDIVDAAVHRVVSHPGPGGSLHPQATAATPGKPQQEESLDAWTYRELCGLHALANLAATRKNQAWAQRVEQIALYHLEHTQPDHTTTQPWALFAFLWSPKTRTFAQQQLHDTTAHAAANSGVGVGAVAGMLLADAAATIAAF